MRRLWARRPERLLELDEVERGLRPFGRRYMGVRTIPIDALIGTDGRAVLHRHRRDAFPSTGCPHLAQTVVSVIGDGRRRPRLRLPGRGARSPA